MKLSGKVTVKLSSEEAGMISLTRVLSQEMTYDELLERIVSITGKDVERIQRILNSGTLLESATRYRWEGADATLDEINERLGRFPDPDPSLPFNASGCVAAFFFDASGRSQVLHRDEGSRRRFLRKQSFWDVVMYVASGQEPHYVTYSYQVEGDRYRLDLSPAASQAICDATELLKNRPLARQLHGMTLVAVEFLTRRGGV